MRFYLQIVIFIPGLLWAQEWKLEMYDQVTTKNFRSNPIFQQQVDEQDIDYLLLDAAIFYLTNEQREMEGMESLKYHKALEIAAWNHSLMMGKKDFFSHVNPKSRKRKEPKNRAVLAGIQNPYLAENVAQFYNKPFTSYLELATLFVNMWMNSKGHRSNILSEKGMEMGCGAYFNGKEWNATQNFQWFEPVIFEPAEDSLPE